MIFYITNKSIWNFFCLKVIEHQQISTLKAINNWLIIFIFDLINYMYIYSHKYDSYFLGQYPCHAFMGSSQYFTLSKKNEFRNEYMCAEVDKVIDLYTFELLQHRAAMSNNIFSLATFVANK